MAIRLITRQRQTPDLPTAQLPLEARAGFADVMQPNQRHEPGLTHGWANRAGDCGKQHASYSGYIQKMGQQEVPFGMRPIRRGGFGPEVTGVNGHFNPLVGQESNDIASEATLFPLLCAFAEVESSAHMYAGSALLPLNPRPLPFVDA
jgi:hypothetical protein